MEIVSIYFDVISVFLGISMGVDYGCLVSYWFLGHTKTPKYLELRKDNKFAAFYLIITALLLTGIAYLPVIPAIVYVFCTLMANIYSYNKDLRSLALFFRFFAGVSILFTIWLYKS